MSRISVIGNVNVDLLVWPAAELPPPGTDVPVESIQTRAAGGLAPGYPPGYHRRLQGFR